MVKQTVTECEMQLDFYCTLCGARGVAFIDPIDSVEWSGSPSVQNVVDVVDPSDVSPPDSSTKTR